MMWEGKEKREEKKKKQDGSVSETLLLIFEVIESDSR